MPRVSATIPTYNHARFVAQAVESVDINLRRLGGDDEPPSPRILGRDPRCGPRPPFAQRFILWPKGWC
jgi:hypothetical protein